MNPSADPSEMDTASWRGQDLRLIPAAATAWLGTLSGLLGGWWITMLCGAAAVVLAIALGVRAHRRASRWVAGLGALAVLGVLTAGPVALRIRAAEHDDLRAAAARGTEATVRVVVTERPRPVRGAGYADRQAGTRLVVVAATVDAVATGEGAVDSAGRILLLAPGEGWTGLLPGQQATASGRLAPSKGAELTVAVLSVRGPPSGLGPVPWWQRAAESLRAGLRELCAVLPEEQAGLVPGLVVGDTSTLSPRVEREFTDSGMSHLMAVSGGNVAIVCGSILLLLRALRVGPRTSAAAAAAGLAGFVVLAGPAPSVLRAGVMGAVGLLALALGRRGSALPALAFAVAGLVIVDPAMAADFGFALSVLATAGLVLLAPRWAEWLVARGVPSGYAEGLSVPLAAFVMTAPVIAGMAGTVSLVSVVTNLLTAPVVAPATVFGVLATVVGPWWPSAGRALVRLTEPEASWLITVARHGARAPGAVVDWPGGWWGGLLAAALLVVLLIAVRLHHARILLAIALAGGLLVFVPVRVLAPAWPPASWSAVACDVGQGDAVVLATAEQGRAVLVDTGPEPGPVDECLSRLGVDRVPLIVLSHLHADHIGGLESVFEGRSVGAVAVGPGRAPAWAWQQVADETARRGIPLLELGIGQRLDWPGLSLEVLGPRYVTRRSAVEQDGTVINNGSVVLRAGTPAGRMLLTGDVELAAQADLMAEGADLHAGILKVPHHGSRYTAPDFLNAVAPRVALVSVGAGNTYGHPNKSTLDNLTAVGASIARTDTDGDTAVVSDTRGLALVRRGEPRGPPRS